MRPIPKCVVTRPNTLLVYQNECITIQIKWFITNISSFPIFHDSLNATKTYLLGYSIFKTNINNNFTWKYLFKTITSCILLHFISVGRIHLIQTYRTTDVRITCDIRLTTQKNGVWMEMSYDSHIILGMPKILYDEATTTFFDARHQEIVRTSCDCRTSMWFYTPKIVVNLSCDICDNCASPCRYWQPAKKKSNALSDPNSMMINRLNI